jgi:hypothetical protein
MSTVWKPTRHAWWIWLVPNLVFTLVGIALIKVSSHIGYAVPSQLPWFSRRTEILLMGIIFIAAPLCFSAILYLFIRRRSMKAERLERTGAEATAKILSFQSTGTMINNLPQYAFRLLLTPEDESQYGAPQEVTMKTCIGYMELQNIQEGRVFRALVDPSGSGDLLVMFGDPLDSESRA